MDFTFPLASSMVFHRPTGEASAEAAEWTESAGAERESPIGAAKARNRNLAMEALVRRRDIITSCVREIRLATREEV
jgi:hypothetical protein